MQLGVFFFSEVMRQAPSGPRRVHVAMRRHTAMLLYPKSVEIYPLLVFWAQMPYYFASVVSDLEVNANR